MSRYRKYKSEKALREAVEAYFDSISRVRTVMEAYNTGKKDSWGHFIPEWRPVTNAKGEPMQEREYVIPPTVGGLCAHLKISRDTWAAYCNGKKNPQFAETSAWAREQMLSWREKELMTRSGKDVKGLFVRSARELRNERKGWEHAYPIRAGGRPHYQEPEGGRRCSRLSRFRS